MPSIKTSVPLLQLGLNRDRTLEVPDDFDRAGWYEKSSKPGAPGPAVVVGHVDSYTGPAAFFRLRELKRGDQVQVARSDGTTASFVVQRLEEYPKEQFPTELVYGPTAEPSLRLITCTGRFDEAERTYLDNMVVFATQQLPRPQRPAPATRRPAAPPRTAPRAAARPTAPAPQVVPPSNADSPAPDVPPSTRVLPPPQSPRQPDRPLPSPRQPDRPPSVTPDVARVREALGLPAQPTREETDPWLTSTSRPDRQD